MARAGSTTSRSTSTARRKSAAVEAAEQAADSMTQDSGTDAPADITAANDFDSALVEPDLQESDSTNEVEETNSMSTETVEAPAEEVAVSDTPKSTTPEKSEEELAAERKAAAELAEKNMDEFKAAVNNALADRDVSTGVIPESHTPGIQAAFRNLGPAKFRKAGHEFLVEKLHDAVNSADIQLGMAVMKVTEVVNATTPAPRPTADRKPVDPAEAFIEKLAALNLAYVVVQADVPEGVATEGDGNVYDKTSAMVEAELASAHSYYAWVKSTDENKGDEPEASPVVKRAIKVAQGRAATVGTKASSKPRTPSDRPNRNVRTHINQVFAEYASGTVLRVSEISNAKTEEYPDGSCSPGAISAALKSNRGVEGVEVTQDDRGNLAARKQ